jgi:hypothetical protein
VLHRRMGQAARIAASERFSAVAQSRMLEDALIEIGDRPAA